MRIFDTDVQKLKYMVLREVARRAYEGRLEDSYLEIPKLIAPGPEPTMRCCVYKERAIVQERVRIALGGDRRDKNIVEIIDIACDECPISTYTVTESCRGCIAHRCEAACPRGAVTFDRSKKAWIDPDKCVECGKCAAVCPYHAIANRKRPCESACKVKAISRGERAVGLPEANQVAKRPGFPNELEKPANVAVIDENKCTTCGACVYQCPFGAASDKSYIVKAINLIKDSDGNRGYRTYCLVAPSISSQFRYAKLGQVIAALKRLGFYAVVEAALGADMVAWAEAKELSEKGFLISSCCPAFVDAIEKQFPKLRPHVSANLSPMATLARFIKQGDPTAKVVFIGPCTAKKAEAERAEVREFVDCVLTFEEMQALIDCRDFDVSHLPEDVLENASYFGRIFARSGGLTDAVREAIREREIDFELKPVICDGIEACRAALLKASRGILAGNFIEGMACAGGCIGGAGCLTHGPKDAGEVDKYGAEALEKKIGDAVKIL